MNCHSFINVIDLPCTAKGGSSPRRAKAAATPPRRPAPRAARSPRPWPFARPTIHRRARLKRSEAEAPRGGEGRTRRAVPTAPAVPFDLPLWPQETRGIALAAGALLIVGLFVSAMGVPSQSSGGVAAVEEPVRTRRAPRPGAASA